MSQRTGGTQRKILLLLFGGLALGLSGSPKRYFKIIDSISKEWKEIEKQSLQRAIKSLYESKLIKEKYNSDGTVTMILTRGGKEMALIFDLDGMKIKKPAKWDNKWRIVIFDIPENRKKTRDAFRYHLKNLEFVELQKSVFVHPYNCEDEISYLIEFYNARKFVRFIVADSIDNELHLKHIFGLI